jgi:CheY-like chemotaxis protein
VFGNGFEAISYLEEHVHQPELLPHVIFLDINMPTMDGWEFLEAFGLLQSKLRQPIHIYMVSSSMDDYDIQKSKEYHMVTDYVIKPINKERFEELIHKTESPE